MPRKANHPRVTVKHHPMIHAKGRGLVYHARYMANPLTFTLPLTIIGPFMCFMSLRRLQTRFDTHMSTLLWPR